MAIEVAGSAWDTKDNFYTFLLALFSLSTVLTFFFVWCEWTVYIVDRLSQALSANSLDIFKGVILV